MKGIKNDVIICLIICCLCGLSHESNITEINVLKNGLNETITDASSTDGTNMTTTKEPNVGEYETQSAVSATTIPIAKSDNKSYINTSTIDYSYIDNGTTSNMNGWKTNGMIWNNDTKGQAINQTNFSQTLKSKNYIAIFTKDFSEANIFKKFPPLNNVTITMTQYFNCSNSSIEGYYSISDEPEQNISKSFFTYSQEEMKDKGGNNRWFTTTHNIYPQSESFKIELKYTKLNNISERCLWAINSIVVQGFSTEIQTQIAPSNNSEPTESDISTTPTTTVLSANDTNNEASLSVTVKEMSKIATAIWDAFFVLLALFCACLSALIILICRNRRREDQIMNTIPRYSPRSSTFQLEKPRENIAYQMDSV